MAMSEVLKLCMFEMIRFWNGRCVLGTTSKHLMRKKNSWIIPANFNQIRSTNNLRRLSSKVELER